MRSGDSPCIHSKAMVMGDLKAMVMGNLRASITVPLPSITVHWRSIMFIYGYQRSFEVYDLAHILSIAKWILSLFILRPSQHLKNNVHLRLSLII
jgi:hypothetical protein